MCGTALDQRWRFCRSCGAPRARGPLPDTTPAAGAADGTVEPEGGPASFGQRAGAAALDWLIVGAAQGLLIGALSIVLAIATPPDAVTGDRSKLALDVLGFLVGFIVVCVHFLYFGLSQSGRFGQTVGQRATNIRLVRPTGDRVGFWRVVARESASILSLLPVGLGYFAMIWNPEKRTWHDRLTGTTVETPVFRAILGSTPTRRIPSVTAFAAACVAVFAGLVVVASVTHSAERVDIAELEAGHCAVDPGFEFDWVRILPCDREHDFEVSGTMIHNEGSYIEERVDAEAAEACAARFTSFVGARPDDTALDFDFIAPTAETWRIGDRVSICLIIGFDPWERQTGSARDRYAETQREEPGHGPVL